MKKLINEYNKDNIGNNKVSKNNKEYNENNIKKRI